MCYLGARDQWGYLDDNLNGRLNLVISWSDFPSCAESENGVGTGGFGFEAAHECSPAAVLPADVGRLKTGSCGLCGEML